MMLKFWITTLVSFRNQRQIKNRIEQADDRNISLVDLSDFLGKLKKSGGISTENADLMDQYRHNQEFATIHFVSNDVRRRYWSSIDLKYSNSAANHSMILQNERSVMIRWAKAFNKNHKHLKIVKCVPVLDQDHYQARCLLIGYRVTTNHKIAFDFHSALKEEYKTDFINALYHLENNERHRFAKIIQGIFVKCVPGVSFNFISRKIGYETLDSLTPTIGQTGSESNDESKKPEPQSLSDSTTSSSDAQQAASNSIKNAISMMASSLAAIKTVNNSLVHQISHHSQSIQSPSASSASETSYNGDDHNEAQHNTIDQARSSESDRVNRHTVVFVPTKAGAKEVDAQTFFSEVPRKTSDVAASSASTNNLHSTESKGLTSSRSSSAPDDSFSESSSNNPSSSSTSSNVQSAHSNSHKSHSSHESDSSKGSVRSTADWSSLEALAKSNISSTDQSIKSNFLHFASNISHSVSSPSKSSNKASGSLSNQNVSPSASSSVKSAASSSASSSASNSNSSSSLSGNKRVDSQVKNRLIRDSLKFNTNGDVDHKQSHIVPYVLIIAVAIIVAVIFMII